LNDKRLPQDPGRRHSYFRASQPIEALTLGRDRSIERCETRLVLAAPRHDLDRAQTNLVDPLLGVGYVVALLADENALLQRRVLMRKPLSGDTQAPGLDVGLLGCPPGGKHCGGARDAIRAKIPLPIRFVMTLGGDACCDLKCGLGFADAQLRASKVGGTEPLEPLVELAT
jgi:hypothetical protein